MECHAGENTCVVFYMEDKSVVFYMEDKKC